MEKKGILSRQIGEAKREGSSIDGLLAEMKQVSIEISQLKEGPIDQCISSQLPGNF